MYLQLLYIVVVWTAHVDAEIVKKGTELYTG